MIKGKLVVIDNLNLFKTMQQSSDPIPDSAVVFIKNEGQIWTKGSYFGVQKTYTTVSKTDAGLAPKGGDSASSLISNVDTEWVLTVTSGASPSWRKLPANAFKNTTYTFYNLAFKNSAGTTVDTYKPTTSPTKTIKAGSNVTISASDDVITIAATDTTYSVMGGASADNNGTSGLVPQPTKGNQAKFLRADGSWATPTNTTYSVVTAAKNGLVPMFDAADGTIDAQDSDWVLTNNNGSIGWYKLPANAFNNSTYSVMSGATTSADGTQGLVPKPTKSNVDMFLKGDGTWATPTNTTYSVVTKTANGLVPKTGTSASATISSEANEWVLTTTSGNTPTWRKLPSAAFTTASYTLPTATTSALGGIKVGSVNTDAFANLSGKFYSVNVDKNGLAYVQVPWTDTTYTLPTATSSKLGGVKVGTTLTDVTGYTAVHIKDGVIYYKDTNSTNYLPLSGGELNGHLTIKTSSFNGQLSIYRDAADGNSVINFANSSGNLGTIGIFGSAGTFPGEPYFQYPGSTEHRLWHTGNDGAGSGLDADLLDGKESSDYGKVVKNETFDLNGIRAGFRAGKILSATNAVTNTSKNRGFLEYGVNGYIAQFNSDQDNSLYYRWCENGYWKSWRTFAFTDSNVASATKLKTARTIWGQSFDGTGNVDGNIVSANTTFSMFANTGKELLSYSTENKYLSLGYGTLADSFTTYLHGYNINLRYGANGTDGLILNSSGNVGIGTTSPSPAFKLHVAGSTGITGSLLFIRHATTYLLADICTTDTTGFLFEAPRKTNSASGEYLPYTFSWRGGWDNYLGILFVKETNGTHINIKHSDASLKLFAWGGVSYIEAGNADFSSNIPLYLTGPSANTGSDLWLNFSNIMCGANKYTLYHSGNHKPNGEFVYNIEGTDFSPSTKDGTYIGMSTLTGLETNWRHVISMNWSQAGDTAGNSTWCSLLSLPTLNRKGIYYRSATSATAFGPWIKLLDSTDSIGGSSFNGEWSPGIMMNGTNSRGSFPYYKWHIPNVNWAQILMNGSGELEFRGGAALDAGYINVRMGILVCTSLQINGSTLTFVT